MTGHRVHPAAREELDEAAERYEAERPGLGADLIDEYERKLAQALRFPESGPRLPMFQAKHDVRQFVFARFPFTLVMATVVETPTVIAVAHQRRRPGYWRGRLG